MAYVIAFVVVFALAVLIVLHLGKRVEDDIRRKAETDELE